MSHGWAELSLELQKELYNNHNKIRNAVFKKECLSMKLWLKLWTNFNQVNCLNSKNQDGVVSDLWFWVKISKTPKIFRELTSYKKVQQVCTLWLEESGLFIVRWEKMSSTKSLSNKKLKEKNIHLHQLKDYHLLVHVQITQKINWLTLLVLWDSTFIRHTDRGLILLSMVILLN